MTSAHAACRLRNRDLTQTAVYATVSDMDALRTLILDALTKDPDLSLRKAAKKAEDAGWPVSYSTLSLIKRGQRVGAIQDGTLRGIAAGFDIPLTRVRKAAGMPAKEHPVFELGESANRLNARQRQLVVDFVNMLLRSGES